MALTKENYTKRLVDDEISELLKMFGAISIEGPKYCGKTWTALNHANSSVLLTKSDNPNSDYQKALINRDLIYTENYPELKANSNFLELQGQLKEVEDKISYARQFYNDSVLLYNNKIEMFPSNLVASMFGFKKETFFEADEKERENVEVKF